MVGTTVQFLVQKLKIFTLEYSYYNIRATVFMLQYSRYNNHTTIFTLQY